LAPFGVGNPKPSFIFKNISISGIKEFGKEKNHLEFLFSKRTGEKVPAIGFFMNSESFKNKNGNNLKIGDKIDLVACMEKSNFRGRPELRLRIIDVV
jgi:single-stranded-DNA-specific exonuclease